MKALVLGGSYFIGRALVETLAKEGFEVWVLNRGNRAMPRELHVQQLIADRHDYESLTTALMGNSFDVVYDLSGYNEDDVAKTSELLKGNVNHYIFLSSIAVCKQPPTHWPITEDHEKCFKATDNEYGFEKWQAEKFLFAKDGSGWFHTTTIRPTYVYGPRNYAQRESYIFERIDAGLPIVIKGSGNNIVQLGYVYDLACALSRIACDERSYGESFNVSGKEPLTVREIIGVAEAVTGKPSVVVSTDDHPELIHEASGFPEVDRYADSAKIESLLGIVPNWNLMSGMAKTYRYLTKEGD